MPKRKSKIKDTYIGSSKELRIREGFVFGMGMVAKKSQDYLATCYLCGTACSASNNSKGIWITDKVMASLCGGCFDRTYGMTKKDTARPDLKTLGVNEGFLIGAGLLGSGWTKEQGSIKLCA